MAILKSRESLAVKYRPKRLEQLIGQEDIVSLLQGQFKSKSGINRSFLLSGPTGCGKCITGDALILTPNGFMMIKDIIPEGSQEGFTEKGMLVCNKEGAYEKTSHVFYEKTSETYRLTTQTNFQIEGTPEHKLLCLEGLTPVWKRLDDITDGDYVAIQRGMNLWPDTAPNLSSFDCPDFDHALFACIDCTKACKSEQLCSDFDPISGVVCRVCGKTFGNLCTHTATHGITPHEYKELYSCALLSASQLYKAANTRFDYFLPQEMTEDLAYLLGYIVAEAAIEGRNISFYNKDAWVIADFKRLYQAVFKAEIHEVYDKDDGVCRLRISGAKRITFFKWLGVEAGHSRTRCIPSIILRSPKNIVAAFLRAYFEGDGGWNGDRVSAYSASEMLIRQLQTVLLNFGIVSTINSKEIRDAAYWDLNIASNDLDLFMEEIGFLTETKRSRYIPKRRNPNFDIIPRVGQYLDAIKNKHRLDKSGNYLIDGQKVKVAINSGGGSQNWSYLRVEDYLNGNEGTNLSQYFTDEYQKLKSLFDLHYYWSKVEISEKVNEEKYVYDVSLPDTHSFFSNGFISHNTTTARIIAHYINCDHFDQEACAPCGKCEYCLDVEKKSYYGGVDEINFSNERGIDTIRAVIESTAYASQFNAHVFICDEIQCLTGLAQNALLKILEEPPEGVVFLLLTTDPQRLLPTIINRCCPLTVTRVDSDEIAKYLLKVCQLEGRDYFTPQGVENTDPETKREEFEKACVIFKNIAMFSNGLVRQALATLEAVLSIVEGGQKIDTQDVEAIRKIVGRFVENPETEPCLAEYLISGIYSGRYGLALSYALKLMQSSQSNSCKYLFEKALDNHIQTLYFLVDPKKKIGNLCDAFYSRWFGSILSTVKKPGGLQLTHQAAADIVGIFMQLISDMGAFVHDERRLVIAYTLKMLDAVNKHRHLAYTKASPFHKVHAPELLIQTTETDTTKE